MLFIWLENVLLIVVAFMEVSTEVTRCSCVHGSINRGLVNCENKKITDEEVKDLTAQLTNYTRFIWLSGKKKNLTKLDNDLFSHAKNVESG